MAAVRFLLSEDKRACPEHAQLACAIHFTHFSACSVHSAAQTLRDTEHGLFCFMEVNRNMHHVLLRHVRAVPDDLVAMDAFFELPEQYRASKESPAYLHVCSWRVIDFEIMMHFYGGTHLTSVSRCVCFDLPFKAPEGLLTLEAVDISLPQNFVCNGQMPLVRLKMRGVPVQASLDDLSRLCFMQRTTCTVCYVREAKHESLEACTKPKNKRRFAMLCDACCKELFVVVQKSQSFHWQAQKWVLDLEAKDELYFFSRVQETVGIFGHPKTPNCGIYALKDQTALAQGFESWPALYTHQCDKKAAKRKPRK